MEFARSAPNQNESCALPDSTGLTRNILVEDRVLFKDDNFLVIDKPHDVRMDGDFNETVEKMVLATYPLLSVSDLKWIHQLDYATSGVLCIGLNREAAAVASLAFENRETAKVYLAIVDGELRFDDFPASKACEILLQEKAPNPAYAREVETSSHQTSAWQDESMKEMLTYCFQELQRLVAEASVDPVLDPELRQLAQTSFETFSKSAKLRKQLRKYLKRKGCSIPEQTATTTIATTGATADAELEVPTTPSLSRTIINCGKQPKDPRFVYFDSKLNRLVVSFPVAEIANEFRMEIGHDGNPGKACSTTIEIVEYARYLGRRVTKVLLYPKTGRRHQLRLHCAAIGHPIVGDWTYNPFESQPQPHQFCEQNDDLESRNTIEETRANGKRKLEEEDHDSNSNNGAAAVGTNNRNATRMMLHAHSLRIPLSKLFSVNSRTSPHLRALKAQQSNENGEPPTVLDVRAVDPFPIIEGRLTC